MSAERLAKRLGHAVRALLRGRPARAIRADGKKVTGKNAIAVRFGVPVAQVVQLRRLELARLRRRRAHVAAKRAALALKFEARA